MIRMEPRNIPLELHKIQEDIQAELENYNDDEQTVILTQFLQHLKKKNQIGSRVEDIKQAFSPPYIWLLLAGGIALPIMLYIIFIWSSLQLEA